MKLEILQARQLIETSLNQELNIDTYNAIVKVYGILEEKLNTVESTVRRDNLGYCKVGKVLEYLHNNNYDTIIQIRFDKFGGCGLVGMSTVIENNTVAEAVEPPIESMTIETNTVAVEPTEITLGTNDIQATEEVFEIEEESLKDDFIQINDNVKIPSMSYAQEYWRTSQTRVVVPSKHINSTKKPPISTLIGVSAMSGKEGKNTIDGTGKGARIMNVRNINRLTEKLIDTRKIKPSTLNTHIRKLLKLKTKEFEYVTLVNPNNNKEEGYYRLDYSDGFVQVDLRVMHYMFTCYSDNIIQAYIVFLWNCREGWAQVTREQMAQHLGLTIHSDKQAKMIMDKLVMDGLVEQRAQYQTVQVVDKATGIPKAVPMPYYEYRVVNIDELIN